MAVESKDRKKSSNFSIFFLGETSTTVGCFLCVFFFFFFVGLLLREHPKAQPVGFFFFFFFFFEKPGIGPLIYKASDLTTAPRRLHCSRLTKSFVFFSESKMHNLVMYSNNTIVLLLR